MALKSDRLRVGVAFLLAARDQRRAKKASVQSATTEQKAWVLTGAYLGLIVVAFGLFYSTGRHLGVVVDDEKLNSLGDFLSGIFAPLAFFWLVVSVKTQSKELAAQREELAMTRQEFVDNREVMREQAAAAEAHKDFVQQQTEIMARQANLADEAHRKNYKVLLFEKRMEVYNEFHALFEKVFKADVEFDYFAYVSLSNKAAYLFPESVKPFLDEVRDLLSDHVNGTAYDKSMIEDHIMNIMTPDDLDRVFGKYLTVTD